MALETERSERITTGSVAGLRNVAGEVSGLFAALASGILGGSRMAINAVTSLAASAAAQVGIHTRSVAQ